VVPRAATRWSVAGLAAVSAAWVLSGCSSIPTSMSASHTPVSIATPSATTSPAAATVTPTPSPPAAWTLPAAAAAEDLSVSSVTFVSTEEGWVLGSAPCGTSSQCLALMRTEDGGKTWVSVTPPPTSLLAGEEQGGVSEVRFANSQDGWAFDPELWSTHDGGATWTQISLPGVSSDAIVSSLETADGVVDAAVLDDNAMVRIETSPVGSDSWQVSPTTIPLGAGPAAMPQLVLQGAVGWLIEDDRTVIGGARLIGGQWLPWQPPCLQVNGAAFLAASTPQDLVAVCDQGAWGPATPAGVYAYVSTDWGSSFAMLGTPLPSSIEDEGSSLASPSPGVAFITASVGLVGTFNGGATWTTVYSSPPGPGWPVYVGFETEAQGVAIWVNDQGLTTVGSLMMTFDGGTDWTTVTF